MADPDLLVDEDNAEIRSTLARADTPVSSHDLLVAAHAPLLGKTLLTLNTGEPVRILGPSAENWLTPQT